MKNSMNNNESIMSTDFIPESNLSPIQQKAIFALMSSKSIEQAARQIGVTSRALHYWLNDIDFLAELRAMQSGLVEQAANQLISAQGNVLSKLEYLMEHSEDERIQLEASRTLLDYITKWYELTKLSLKLDRLEQMTEGEYRR